MANPDDTSKPRRSRRSPISATAAPLAASSAPSAPPRTLEEAIENVRTLLMQIRATLHCLSDVLLYADDDDAVLHAEVAKALEGWVNEAAVELDLVKLRPLIESIRQGGGGEPGQGGPDPTGHGPYMVREPTPVYMV